MKSTVRKRSAGGIIHHDSKFLALIVIDYNEVIFPKGTIEEGEAPEQTAVREVFEETGYRTKIKAPLGEISYEFDEDGQPYQKTVNYFLLELIDEGAAPTPNRQQGEGFENVWLTANEAFEKLTHENSKNLLKKALKLL